MIRFLGFVLAVVCIMNCGCATIFSDSMYPVNINSEPPGASFEITDNLGRTLFTGRTPAAVVLDSGSGYFQKAQYRVDYEKPGYLPTTRYLQANFDGWYLANGCWVGSDFFIGFLLIDPITGAMWKLDGYVSAKLLSAETESKAVQ